MAPGAPVQSPCTRASRTRRTTSHTRSTRASHQTGEQVRDKLELCHVPRPRFRAMQRATSRRSHPKSRTGCATCKSRRVKVSKQVVRPSPNECPGVHIPNLGAGSVTSPSLPAATASNTMSSVTLSAALAGHRPRPRDPLGPWICRAWSCCIISPRRRS